jgi:hypothetical protein
MISGGTNVVGRNPLRLPFTYFPPMEALCSPQGYAPAFETKQRHHPEKYNLHTDVKFESLGLSFHSQVMYIWRLARLYFSFLLSASLLSLNSQKMNRRLKYTDGDIRITRELTVLWGLSSVRVTGATEGQVCAGTWDGCFCFESGANEHTSGTAEGLGVRFSDPLRSRT